MLFPLIKLARGHINEKSCDSNTIGILRSLPALKQDNDKIRFAFRKITAIKI